MTKKFEIYKCEICGNIVQILQEGECEIVCCNQPMKLMKIQYDKSSELGEKHCPKFFEENDKKYVHVKNHPMIDEHYIEFIEIYPKDRNEMYIKYFKPNDIPKAEIPFRQDEIDAIELCNIHGLWGSD